MSATWCIGEWFFPVRVLDGFRSRFIRIMSLFHLASPTCAHKVQHVPLRHHGILQGALTPIQLLSGNVGQLHFMTANRRKEGRKEGTVTSVRPKC